MTSIQQDLHASDSDSITLFACLPGDEIIQKHAKNLLIQIHSLVSAPVTIYHQLYYRLIYRLAEFCQAIPLSKDCSLYSLFIQQLRRSIAALKLRRGLLLPPNASAETMAESEPQWTFAIFSAALLYELSSAFQDKQIILHHKHDNKIHWDPLTGCLYQPNAYFLIEWQSQPAIAPQSLMKALVDRLIAPAILNWLKQNKLLFHDWWQVITSQSTSSILFEIIQKSIHSLQPSEKIQVNETTVTQHPSIETTLANDEVNTLSNDLVLQAQDNVQTALETLFKFIDSLDHQAHSLQWLRITEGLLVKKEVLQQFLAQHNAWKDITNFIQAIKETLKQEQDQFYFRYRPIAYEDRRIIEGLVIKERALNDSWKHQPIHSEFKQANQL